ncbi:ABC transporter ATP-binding protein/permease [Ciceribacter sp. L1K22]|uniref:ABC transporter ATP-binding protein/permease n=1 Tax=Ciceribacter sp. L1K22 TaxID=2820275 RepID=UPI001ABE2A45|nr:ABC transporter ATP-binding protein/permease [Ciceribacter sp. L1K22]MBO3758187.1 ABC transporter ATP-binding protein/permease [Ciceribacter sp. L1K22]
MRISDLAAVTATTDTTAASMELSFGRQLKIAADSFWQSASRNRIIGFAIALLGVILLTAYGTVLLNQWNAPFYNALERRDLPAFIKELQNFAVIAGCLLLLNVIQTWLNQMTALSMREGLSRDVVDQWLTDRRAYRLSVSSPLGINPDQRLHEDARKLAEMTASLAIGLVQSTILLASFVGVLWTLSNDFVFHVDGRSFAIPGYLVWGALLYATAAALLSQLVGRSLSRLNAERYAKEADLRFALMRANENLEAITLARAGETERRHIHETIDTVLATIRRLALALTNLTWVTAGFGWLAIVVPILIASPAYFAGTITFGGLMMAAAAFTQVYSALRWYVDNFGQIADWQAALMRVTVFRAALTSLDGDVSDKTSIVLETGPTDSLAIERLEVCARPTTSGCETGFRLHEQDAVIRSGDRVMINGDQGINRKLLFNALGGLWTDGTGMIRLPEGEAIHFVPQQPYLPEGKLRSLLVYPAPSADFSDTDMVAALTRVGLANLSSRLDERNRWDRQLDKDEQAELAFASLLLRRPRWIVFEEVLEGLEPETVGRLVGVMQDLSDSTLIYIGRSAAFNEALSPKLLHLEKLPTAP